jgi:diguanylate cyclase (GGDEF)-like protein
VLTASSAALFASVNGVTYWLPWVVLAGFGLAVALTLVLLQRVALANRRLARTNDELGRNVAELHESQERLAHEALHDALTELPNRTLFNDRLAQALARCERHPGYSCAVLFLDLDRFKVINDGFSHAAGDELLVALAHRIAGSLRPGDTVARFGGDEFTLLLDDVGSAEEASEIAERLCSRLERPVWLSGRELFVTASIGIALSRRGASSDELLRNADIAMYHAKAQGQGRVAVFDGSMHIRIVRKVWLEGELREAIERRHLQVFYQPIVDLGSGCLSGLEALARWPGHGPEVTPDEFIAVAEETGLIGALGRFVLDDACMRLSDWRSRGLVADHVTVSVNVSARQLTPDLADIVTAALRRSGLPPTALRLEITETTIMQAPERVETVLAKLERNGVRAQIDDFGTGYSSLSSLHGFRGDALKIDRAFVGSLHENEGSEAIVGGIIALAHNVNLQVIAEGVDHPAQVGKLRKLGCEYAQGFLLCTPLPPATAEERLRTWDAGAIAAIGAPTPVDPTAPAGEADALTSA